MGIGRVLIFGLVIWFAWFIFKRLNSNLANRRVNQRAKQYMQKKKNEAASKVSMIKQCEVCSVHVPENEAIEQDGLYYCCEAHARKN